MVRGTGVGQEMLLSRVEMHSRPNLAKGQALEGRQRMGERKGAG